MSANLNARNFTQPSVFAENAQTIIPVTPSIGIAYRDPNVNPALWSAGQPFDSIVDSRIWNQLLYALSAFAAETEQFCFARWSPMTNYTPGASVTSIDGNLYRAVRASGPALGVGPRLPADYPDYWVTLKDWLASSQGPVGGVVPVGMIDLLPFRFNALPFGWYFCNGERYADTVPAGPVLQALPQSLRDDWGITTTSAGTNVPLMLDSSGRGYFLRAVNGTTRAPGSVEQDAARPVTASASTSTSITNNVNTSGATGTFWGVGYPGDGTGCFKDGVHSPRFDAGAEQQMQYTFELPPNSVAISSSASSSTSVSVSQANQAAENRPVNIGMTPAIYLGV